ncbi:unnamed protein product [Tilletia laevis]|nr:unnamed protein product [Tilletia caries]CAD6940079.1 unnamed protein product [Tilletia controversa]CAD6960749.1 unnamed protein product [Tilletia laevis]CAD6958968.1 unnamed protein product [Tilletia controversa]CAD6976302.1 unnamed protein product [Tilletia controversa]
MSMPVPPVSMSARSRPLTMGERDLNKMEAQMEDAGYREGITAGKLSTFQSGFDEGFSTVGAPLGRVVGRLRGEATSLCVYVSRLAADLQPQPAGPSAREGSSGHGAVNDDDDGEEEEEEEGSNEDGPQQHIELQYEDGDVLPGRQGRAVNGHGGQHSSTEALHPIFAKEDVPPGPGRARVRLKSRGATITSSTRPSGNQGGSGSGSGRRGVGGAVPSSRMLANNPTTAHLKPADILTLLREAQALLKDTQELSLEKLAPPDEEALAHEHEHAMMAAAGAADGDARAGSGSSVHWTRESEGERARREAILPGLYARLHAVKTVLGLV